MSTADNNLAVCCEFNQHKILLHNLDTEPSTGLENQPLSQKCLCEKLSSDISCVNVPDGKDQDNKILKEIFSLPNSDVSILVDDEISVGNNSNASSPRSNVLEDQRSQFSDSAYGSWTSISRNDPQARRLRDLARLMMNAEDARRIDIRPSPQVRPDISRRSIVFDEESDPQRLFDRAEVKCFLFGILCLQIIIASLLMIGYFAKNESDMIMWAVILFCLMGFALWKFQYYLIKLCIQSREENISPPSSPPQ